MKDGHSRSGPVLQHQFLEVGQPDHAFDLHHLVGVDVQFVHDDAAQGLGGVRGDFHAHHFAATAAFQGDLEFAHQILGLFLDFQIAVA